MPESQMLLPTIVSRCCQVRFQPLDDEIVAECLAREDGLSPDEAARIAAACGGKHREGPMAYGRGPESGSMERSCREAGKSGRAFDPRFFPDGLRLGEKPRNRRAGP